MVFPTRTLLLGAALALSANAQGETAPWEERALPQHSHYDDPANAFESLREQGELLFDARFTSADGAGRPMATQAIIPTKRRRAARNGMSRTAGPDASACSSCHNVPVIGGAGDFSANVFVSEGFEQADFDTIDPQFSNERNSNHLFGAGLVELLAREISAELQQQRADALARARQTGLQQRIELTSKGVSFGSLEAYPDGIVDAAALDGVDQDLVIRPFSHKGVMTSLRQFTINALNHHHGMQADERYGARWTGESDHDEDGHEREMLPADISALVAWQAALPAPLEVSPAPRWQATVSAGKALFGSIGCAECHRPSLPLESLVFTDPGPLDAAGTLRSDEHETLHYDLGTLGWVKALPRDEQGRVLVPLYGDLKRHVIADQRVSTFGNELLAQRFVERNVFQTTELWGVGSTAPYGHRGDIDTLSGAIEAHGGAAAESRAAWQRLQQDQRNSLIAFLKSLRIATE